MKKFLLFLGIILGTVACLSAQSVTAVQLAGYDNGTIIPTDDLDANPAFVSTDPQWSVTNYTLYYYDQGNRVEHTITGNSIPTNILTDIRNLAEPVKVYGELTVVGPGNANFIGFFSFAKQN